MEVLKMDNWKSSLRHCKADSYQLPNQLDDAPHASSYDNVSIEADNLIHICSSVQQQFNTSNLPVISSGHALPT
jgi:hypothetical protein